MDVDEPWGVRRFYVRDPFGKLVNILAHRDGPARLRGSPTNGRLSRRAGDLYPGRCVIARLLPAPHDWRISRAHHAPASRASPHPMNWSYSITGREESCRSITMRPPRSRPTHYIQNGLNRPRQAPLARCRQNLEGGPPSAMRGPGVRSRPRGRMPVAARRRWRSARPLRHVISTGPSDRR